MNYFKLKLIKSTSINAYIIEKVPHFSNLNPKFTGHVKLCKKYIIVIIIV